MIYYVHQQVANLVLLLFGAEQEVYMGFLGLITICWYKNAFNMLVLGSPV